MRGREITGTIEANGQEYRFSYAPTSSAVVNRRLELTGTFSVSPARGRARPPQTGVRATLSSTQGGLGKAPSVRAGVTGANRPDERHRSGGAERRKAGRGDGTGRGGGRGARHVRRPSGDRGDGTDRLRRRTLYLRLSPLDGRALGLPLDMSSVQLNARLAPASELERDLQWLLSGAVAAVYGERPNERAASGYLGEINRKLKG